MKTYIQTEDQNGLQAFDTLEQAQEALQAAADCDIYGRLITQEQFKEFAQIELSQLADRVQYLTLELERL